MSPKDARTPARLRARVEDVAARMTAEPAEPYPLTALASEAGISRFQFLRAFREVTDRSPRAFLLEARIARARALLDAGLPATEVAQSCGFFDQAHFTRAFKRAVGETPARFARSRRQSAATDETQLMGDQNV